MARNLDLTALRSFVAVADAGGVTRAAGLLNLTQSAVSMQLKRLEEALGQCLFSRTQRRLVLSPQGELLLSYSRRMLDLNDEALSRLLQGEAEAEIRIGVPYDIVYPAIPQIMKRLSKAWPLTRINLVSSYTIFLKEEFERGRLDLILTTEEHPGPGSEILDARSLLWIGGTDGTVWQRRPLRLGFKKGCIFRSLAQRTLDQAGIPWEMAVEGEGDQLVDASVAADLAVTVRMAGSLPEATRPIPAGSGLPDLGQTRIGLYSRDDFRGEVADALRQELRLAYCEKG